MSGIYHTEPPTQGKVLLKTSYGDIDIELWSREAPLACRNFIQLSLEGYYDNTPINRIIKDFMVQMGDPTGTGTGGESIWSRPFKDEIHGRIKFNHRGQVAMANENKPNSNHSQFFITLGACEWIDRKHTIFGKVTGNTIFNVIRMGEADIDNKDRPTEIIKILSVEVLWNPFDDIIPRDLSHLKKYNDIKPIESNGQKAKKELKAIKDTKLLSFGEEEEEEIDEPVGIKRGMHSSHDSNIVKDPKLSAQVASDLQDIQKSSSSSSSSSLIRKSINTENHHDNNMDDDGDNNDGEANDWDKKMRLKILEKRMEVERRQGYNKPQISKVDRRKNESDSDDDNDYDDNNEDSEQQKINERSKEYQKQRDNLLRSKRAIQVLTGSDAEKLRKDAAYQNLTTPLELRRQKFIKRKNEFGNRQDDTLAKLAKFSEKIKEEKKSLRNDEKKEDSIVIYSGQVLEKDIFEDDGEDDNGWHAGKLKFKKHIDDSYRNKDSDSGWETIDTKYK